MAVCPNDGMTLDEYLIEPIKIWFLTLRRAKIRKDCPRCGYLEGDD